MATKKAASAKKAKPTTAKQTKTKVTTVKAVAAEPKSKATAAAKTVKPKTLQGRSEMLGAYIAEFIGTFILAGIVVFSQGQPLYVGFGLIAIVLTIGALSGSHVNPLVTVGAWATRKIAGARALGYIAAQILGALLAYVVASAFVNAAPEVSDQAAMMGQQAAELFKAAEIPADKGLYIFFAEMLGAAIFGLAFSSAVREKHNRAAQALTVGLGLFTAITIASIAASYVGGSAILNPAIAFTLQAISFTEAPELWAVLSYLVAPLIGGVIGFFLFDVIRGESDGGDDKLVKDEL